MKSYECVAVQQRAFQLSLLKPWFHVEIKIFLKNFKMYFTMESRLHEIKKIGQSTGGGVSGVKFFKIILF